MINVFLWRITWVGEVGFTTRSFGEGGSTPRHEDGHTLAFAYIKKLSSKSPYAKVEVSCIPLIHRRIGSGQIESASKWSPGRQDLSGHRGATSNLKSSPSSSVCFTPHGTSHNTQIRLQVFV